MMSNNFTWRHRKEAASAQWGKQLRRLEKNKSCSSQNSDGGVCCKRHEAGLRDSLNLCICNASFNMLMWFLTGCDQTGPDLEAKAWWSQQIAWAGLRCVSPGLWMTGSLWGWQVIIHSPGVPHPSLDTTQPTRKELEETASHPRNPPSSLFPCPSRSTALVASTVATGYQPLSKWNMRCHRPVTLSGAGPNKVPYVADEKWRLTVASWSTPLHPPSCRHQQP